MRRLVGEFGIIVVGVLVALAIDSWWSERQERTEERDVTALMLFEFQSNLQRLDTVAAQDRESLDAGYQILDLIGKRAVGQDVELPASLVWNLAEVWTFNPVQGGLNSLIDSGQLDILQDPELRVALAGWPDIVADLHENEAEEWNNSYETLIPFLEHAGVWKDVLIANGKLPRLDQHEEAADMSVLIEEPLFGELVANRVMNLHILLDEVATVQRGIESILAMLKAGAG